jgi:hypothetical protein
MPSGLRDGPPNNPGGLQAYNGLIALQTLEGGWWGEQLSGHEALIILLNHEFGNLRGADLSTPDAIPAAPLEAAANKYQLYCSEGVWSAECLNGFWAYSHPITDAGIREEYSQSIRDHGRYNDSEAMAYLGATARQIEDLDFPGSDLPTHWVTILDDATASEYYGFVVDLGMGAAPGQKVYWSYPYWGDSGLESLFVVFTDDQYPGTLR